MKLEIITTPNETMKETGFGTQIACTSVMNSIKKSGHSVRVSSCTTEEDLRHVLKRKPDLAILAVKYVAIENGKDIWLSEYFTKNSVAHSGSSREALKFDSDKVLAKTHLKNKGIATAEFFTAFAGEHLTEDSLPLKYPLFLKPRDAANGNGIDDQSYISTFVEFQSKVASIKKSYNQPTIAEEYLGGREFTVAVLQTKSGELIVSPIEIIPPKSNGGRRILGSIVKKENSETLKKIKDSALRNRIKKMAVEVFIGVGADDFARIDIKTNTEGKCFFMEVNLVPGMTFGSSYFPEACRIDQGMTYDQAIFHIVDQCLNKEIKKTQRTHLFPLRGKLTGVGQ